MMHTMTERYINPFTDYGFKRIFGEELNKNLLLDFLNELLRDEEGQIVEITYLKNEHLGSTELDRRAIFDLYCKNDKGERFIVELQKTKQKFFKDRALYYATFPIKDQAKKGDWNFKLEKVYTIGILDFVFDEDKDTPDKYRYDIKLSDIETNEVFSDKLNFIYLEMPKFNKKLDELESGFDKWLYVIKNLSALDEIPETLKIDPFEQLFETAEIAKFNREESMAYEDSLKYYRDLKNSFDTAREEGMVLGIEVGKEVGRIEGRKEGKIEGRKEGIKEGIAQGETNKTLETARKMLEKGYPESDILDITGITKEQLLQLY